MSQSFWSHSDVTEQNISTLLMLYIIKSCCDDSDVANELSHPNLSLPYKPFGEPLWIPHMHILIYVHSVLYDHHETQSRVESGHKTAWSQVNCQTQTRVLIINAMLHTAALNHRQISSLVPFKVIWSQFVIKRAAEPAHQCLL